MIRAALATLCVAATAWAAAWGLGQAVMPAYLAVWLVFLAIPAGALPLVMGLELAGREGDGGGLRRLLALMPAAALCGVPVLLWPGRVFSWPLHQAGVWFSAPLFAVRGAVILAIWTVLCLTFLRAPRSSPRTVLCGLGLATHGVLGTLAAVDWVMSLSPGLNSAGFGVLVMAGQCGLAASVWLVLEPHPPRSGMAILLAGALAWAILHMTHYLVIWSANRPSEIIWYIQRAQPLGVAGMWFGASAVLVSVVALGAFGSARVRACAALLLAAHVTETFWLVTPSVRGIFLVSLADAGGLLGLALAGTGLLWASRPARAAA